MEKEYLNNISKVYTVLLQAVYAPSFKVSQGGASQKALTRILEMMEKDYGQITGERMVDFCISAAYANRAHLSSDITRIFGPASWERYKMEKHQVDWYQDKWLEKFQIDRVDLYNLVKDRSEHPLMKFLYMESEEPTKTRLFNTNAGYAICQMSTLGWSPLSECCQQCVFTDDCKQRTEKNYPELYRLRCDYAKKYSK